MFTLLNELEDIGQISLLEESIKLCEDVGKFLQPIVAKIADAAEHDKNPFDGENALNKEETASIITGLKSLADPDERAAHDVLGADAKFFVFLNALGEKGNPNTDKAEKHLKNFFKTHASYKSTYQKILASLSTLENAVKDENDKKARTKIADDMKKLTHNLQMQMNKLKTSLASKKMDKGTAPEAA